jgi:L-ascorbate oxidase
VSPGKVYRFRFIGATAISLVSLGVESHDNLTIIAADASYTQPYSVSHVQVASGQRFDVLFHAKTDDELEADSRSTYFIQMETRERPSTALAYAVLRYVNSAPVPAAPSTRPLTLPKNTSDWAEYALQPLVPNDFPSLNEVTRRVIVTVAQVLAGTIVWRQDNTSFTEQSRQVPYLVDIYKKGDAAIPDYDGAVANGGIDPVFNAFPARIGEVLEIVIQNTGSLSGNGSLDVHPFHAHGGHFYDIGSGDGIYDLEANENRLAATSPVKRDTTMLFKYAASTGVGQKAGWRAWRLRVQDPGVWMIHCHILQHMVMGMQTVWIFGDANQITRIPHPMSQGYLTYGGSAYGNGSVYPRVVHQFG